MQSSLRTSRYLYQLLSRPTKDIAKCDIGWVQFSSLDAKTVNSESSSEEVRKWQIVGAVCITRPPVISPEMAPIEKEFSKLLAKLEIDSSIKSDHELRLEKDALRAKLQNTELDDDEDHTALDGVALETAQDLEDSSIKELNTLTVAPRVTEADKTGNLSVLDRALDRSLLLVVKQKLGEDYKWIFPQSHWLPGETLRQTCERTVQEKIGSELNVKLYGNVPRGFYKYKYPKHLRSSGYIGAKVFFYKGQVTGIKGAVHPGEDIAEYQWLSQDQLDGKFKKKYAHAVSRFLVSDQ